MAQVGDLVNVQLTEATMAPHCDHRVLHAPGECTICDRYPERQAGRIAAKIAFTGHKPTPNSIEIECPSDAARGTGGAHVWGGNRAWK